MLKNMIKISMVLGAVLFVSGCSSTQKTVQTEPDKTTTVVKKIETRFYADDRERVDQEMEGNFGYIGGTSVPEDRSQYKKTRRVYVFEVTKNVDEAVKVENIQVEPYHLSPSQPLPPAADVDAGEPDWARPVAIPALDSAEPKGAPYMEEYVIQEGDTLQKISKKFYDSYSKWLKIYEANTDVLKDPNRIKPGLTIQIPMN